MAPCCSNLNKSIWLSRCFFTRSSSFVFCSSIAFIPYTGEVRKVSLSWLLPSSSQLHNYVCKIKWYILNICIEVSTWYKGIHRRPAPPGCKHHKKPGIGRSPLVGSEAAAWWGWWARHTDGGAAGVGFVWSFVALATRWCIATGGDGGAGNMVGFLPFKESLSWKEPDAGQSASIKLRVGSQK